VRKADICRCFRSVIELVIKDAQSLQGSDQLNRRCFFMWDGAPDEQELRLHVAAAQLRVESAPIQCVERRGQRNAPHALRRQVQISSSTHAWEHFGHLGVF
jgi:hypothetical protein